MRAELQAVRGMHDILPVDSHYWRTVEEKISSILIAYGYDEIRTPVLEKTDLFHRSIGEVTDIVEKEMYTFVDRNGESLTLRPEGTASCVRACLENGLIGNTQRLWYLGPMFRHERPQKGRYRQFYQVGVETFGISDADIDAELISLSRRIWRELGLESYLTLEINTLGSSECRRRFKDKLVQFLELHLDQLDDDSRRRLHSNPLRILDSKNPQVKELIRNAPKLIEFIDDESISHYQRLKELLVGLEIPFVENPHLVRGLDYYSRTVFEWTTDKLGAQSTVCAGGRYDGLVEQLGGKPTPACGFALGVERLIVLLRETAVTFRASNPDIYMVGVGANAQINTMRIAEELRDRKQLRVMVNCGGGSFKAQMKRADKSGARWAVLIGDDEIARDEVVVKSLRDNTEQCSIKVGDVSKFFERKLLSIEDDASGSL